MSITKLFSGENIRDTWVTQCFREKLDASSCMYGMNCIIEVVLPYHKIYTETVLNYTIYFFGL